MGTYFFIELWTIYKNVAPVIIYEEATTIKFEFFNKYLCLDFWIYGR